MITEHPYTVTKSKELIVFVHVPKTAGTSVNTALEMAGLVGQSHIEHWLDKPSIAKKIIPQLDWVSGHMSLLTMKSFLAGVSNRKLRFFATIRLPQSQVASHYNWLIEIFHRRSKFEKIFQIRPRFYKRHPDRIKDISERIRRNDNSDPSAIIAQLAMEPHQFLNVQSRVLLGDDALTVTEAIVKEKLRQYEFVATESNVNELIQKIVGTSALSNQLSNKSRYHFDPCVFRTEQMTEFLNEFNSADNFVYDIVTESQRNVPYLA